MKNSLIFREFAKLIKKQQLQEHIFSLEFESNKIADSAKPGQFVNLLVEGHVLRRPFSILQAEKNRLQIGFKIKGAGTEKMAQWLPNQTTVDMLGPLGHGFLPPKPNDNVLVVGGGIGAFALLELAKQCASCCVVLGFKTANEVVLQNEFKKHCPVFLCLEDRSTKHKLVTEPLESLIELKQINRIACCGPLPMMKAVFKIAKKMGVFCEVCLEERMACGIGACLGCQCNIKKNGELHSKHICCDGPVFDAEEVFFYD